MPMYLDPKNLKHNILPFAIKVEKPRFSLILGALSLQTTPPTPPKKKIDKIYFTQFSAFTLLTPPKKLEKFNALVCY